MKYLSLLLLLPLLLSNIDAAAAPQKPVIGRVIVSVGKFVAHDASGSERPLKRRSEIFNGDTLITGDESRAQIRFKDGALIALRPGSVFHIKNYHYDGKADGSESAAFELLKGGLRTISGVIGHKHKQNYSMQTPMATIGIRGTHYLLQLCSNDCGNSRSGLYGGVVSGSIAIINKSGTRTIDQDQYFHVADLSSNPSLLLQPPSFLIKEEVPAQKQEQTRENTTESKASAASESDTKEEGDSNTQTNSDPIDSSVEDSTLNSSEVGDAAETTQTELADSTDIASTEEQYATADQVNASGTSDSLPGYDAPVGARANIAFLKLDAADGLERVSGPVIVDGTDNTIRLNTINGADNVPIAARVQQYNPNDPTHGCNPCTFTVGTSTLAEIGGLGGTGLGVNWGRWGTGYVVVENGDFDTDKGNFHYIYSPNTTPLAAVQSMTGTFNYSYVGGTQPTDETGTAGSMVAGGTNLTVNFTTQQITALNLQMSVNSRNISASLNSATSISQALDPNQGLQISGLCSGGACGSAGTNMSGSASLSFVGPAAERAITSFGLDNRNCTTACTTGTLGVVGTAALQR